MITLDPSADLDDGPVYVAITDGYWDAQGNQGAAANATFTVDTSVAAPVFSPAGGTTVTSATGNVTLTFAEAIHKDASGTALANTDLAGLLTLKKTDASGTGIPFTATIDAAKKVITLDPSADLDDGPVYVAITDGYWDAQGNQGAAANATFTVDTSVAAPVFSPAGGTTVTSATGNVTLTFAEAIHKDASGTALANTDLAGLLTLKKTDASGTGIPFTATIDAAKKVITLDPSADLDDGPVYVAITDGYWDAQGNQGAAANATFTVDATGPAASGATVAGTALVITFDEPLGAASSLANGSFEVKKTPSGGSETTVTLSGSPSVSGSAVTLTLGAAVVATDTAVKVSYTKPTTGSGNRLVDAVGNEAASFAGQAVTNAVAPSVTAVALSSDPGTDKTYVLGDTIDVTVTFDVAVTVDTTGGTPDIGIDFSTEEWGFKNVSYHSGSGTKSLVFRWTVVANNTSTEGVSVPGPLTLNGGTIRSAAGTDATLAFTALGHDASHLIDTAAPTVSGSPAVASDAGTDDTYAIGDAIEVTVTFSEDVTVTGTPQLEVAVGSNAREADYASGSGSTGLTFSYTVAAGDADADGISVVANKLTANGGTIADAGGNAATLTHAALAAQSDHKVDGVRPTVSGASVDGTALTVTFDEPLGAASSLANGSFEVKKTPSGGSETTVTLSGSPSVSGSAVTLTLGAAVVATDTAVKVSYTKPTTGSANRVVDAAGNEAASFADRAATNAATPTNASAPTLASVAVDDATGRVVTLTFDADLKAMTEAKLKELMWSLSVAGLYSDGIRMPSVRTSKNAISGKTLTLRFGSGLEALRGRPIAVSYRADIAQMAGAQLRGVDGVPVESFSSPTAMRTATGPIAPVLTAAAVAGTKLTLTFDGPLDTGSAPAGRRFSVMTDISYESKYRDIAGTGTVAISGSTVTVTLAAAVAQNEAAYVYYRPGNDANPLRRTGSGPKVTDIVGFIGAVVSDRTVPKLASAGVAGTKLALYYNEPLDPGSTPATGDFTVTAGSNAQTVSAVSVSSSGVTLTLGASVAADSAVTLGYTAGTNPIRDVAGNKAANLSGQSVTNHGPTDTAAPALASTDPAVARLGVLTLTYDKSLDPGHAPAASAFTLTSKPVKRSVTSVAVRGKTVVLGLDKWAYPCSSDDFTLSYTKPAGASAAKLQSVWGQEAAALAGQAVTIDRERCLFSGKGSRIVPVQRIGFDSGPSGQSRMTMRFKRSLKRSALPGAEQFTVTSDGGGGAAADSIPVEEVAFPADPAELTLTLGRAPVQGERLTVRYRLPHSGFPGLQTAESQQVPAFSVETVVGGAAATGVAMVSEPGGDATYAAGETVRVAVTFDGAVTVDTAGGTPRLKLDLDDGAETVARWAAYEDGSGTDTLTFAWQAAAPDEAPAGVAVLADTLELNGGTIKSAATGADAALGHAGLAHDPAHRVDAASPRLLRGRIDGATMTLTFSEALDPDSAGGRFRAVVQTSRTSSAGFFATGDVAIDGATVTVGLGAGNPRAKAGLPDGNGVSYFRLVEPGAGALRDVAGNPVATPNVVLGFGGGWRSSGSIKLENVTGAPRVTVVAVSSDAGGDATYAAGDTVRVAVTFDGAVEVDTAGGTPRLQLDLGGDDGTGARWAAFEDGSGTDTLTFAWRAAAPDEAPAGIAVLADTLELNGGTIRAAATQQNAALGHAGLDHDPAHRVDAAPPELLRGEIDGATVTLTFSEALDSGATGGRFWVQVQTERTASAQFFATGEVMVDGAAVTVGLGEDNPRAQPGLNDSNRVIYARRADGADAALRDLAGNPLPTPLFFPAFGDEKAATPLDLENVTGRAPRATGVALVSDPGADDTYALGEKVRVELTFSTAVAVDTAGGTPALTIDLDPAAWGEKRAAYAGGSGTDTLVFVHEVVEPNLSTEGVAVLADTLVTDGATIRSAETQADAALGHAGLDHDPAHRVDWRLAPVPVAVTGVEVVSEARADDKYTDGETVEAAVSFDAPVRVETAGGAPTLALIANGGIRRAAYVSGSGTARLVFAYRVAEADGGLGAAVRVAASGLRLNGGAIVAAAGGAPASLGFGDAPGVTAVSVGTQADGRWEAGDTVEVTLDFAEPVAVEGAPTVAVTFGDVERRAAYARGSGGETLTFVYTLHEVEVWQGTVGLAGDSLRLDGGSIVSAGGGLAAALAHAGAEGAVAPPPPSVTGVAVVSDPGSDATYGLGERIRVRVSFAEAVTVTGTPEIAIDMDPAEWGRKRAVYESGSGSSHLVFVHEVAEPNVSTQGIAVLADTLEANGGAIVSTVTGADALLGHAGLGHDPAHKVDWRLAPPAPSSGGAGGDRRGGGLGCGKRTAPTSWATRSGCGSPSARR